MSDSFEILAPIAEANAAAFYLTYNLNFNYWPKYFKNLLLCYNPYEYQVRYFQVQFCIINHISFDIYCFILQLNYHVGLGELNREFKTKLQKLYEHVYRKAQFINNRITSYSISLDGIVDYHGNFFFTRDEMGNYHRTNQVAEVRWCNYRSLREYLRSCGVYHHFYNSY